MNNLEGEIGKLKKELAKARKIIALQKRLLKELEDNYIYDVAWGVADAFQEYNDILNPISVEVNGSFQNRPEVFKINALDVICIKSSGRVKTIMLNRTVHQVSGERRPTNVVMVNDNTLDLEKLRHKIDSRGNLLIQVSKSSVVNMKYYALSKNYVVLCLEKSNIETYRKIKIGKEFIDKFKEYKDYLDGVISLHKSALDYIKPTPE